MFGKFNRVACSPKNNGDINFPLVWFESAAAAAAAYTQIMCTEMAIMLQFWLSNFVIPDYNPYVTMVYSHTKLFCPTAIKDKNQIKLKK